MSIPNSTQELVLLDFLGIEPPAQPELDLWQGVSEVVYCDGDLGVLEAYSEWWSIHDQWRQKRDTN